MDWTKMISTCSALVRHPRQSLHTLSQLRSIQRGMQFARNWAPKSLANVGPKWPERENGIREYFESKTEGHGILKWEHYFDIYERHFSRFVGREVHLLEVGIYSGGSLEMWRSYLGPKCQVYGVDIEPACRAYEKENVRVFIGDQEDRSFWKTVKDKVPIVDIVIDDGGHLPEQQIVTLEELLPHLRPGGVFLCEDIHGDGNEFAAYVRAVADQLNTIRWDSPDHNQALAAIPTPLQQAVSSVHLYPFVAVIDRLNAHTERFACTRRGTQWQPHTA
jgi:SAM-dependent methyltransferase